MRGLSAVKGRPETDSAAGGIVELYRREYPSVVGLITTLVGDRSLAEDITQEAFGKAHRHWDRVRGYERPGAWIRRVAVNDAISWHRARGREERLLARLASSHAAEPPELTDVWRAVAALPASSAPPWRCSTSRTGRRLRSPRSSDAPSRPPGSTCTAGGRHSHSP